jgi:diguanylate cyclase (GGDEF)-like protein/PAS domain S-box-containing protein
MDAERASGEAPLRPAPLRVLVVEDRPPDAELVALRLEDDGFDLDWSRVDTEAAYLAALEDGPDLILSDWNLPGFGGLQALSLMLDRGLDIPFVIVSGTVGEEVAIDALQRGASDYVLKDRPARLGSAVRGALDRHRLRTERKLAEAQLQLAATVFRSSAEGVVITDVDGIIVAVNRAFTEITGYAEAEVLGRNPRFLQSGRQDVSFYRDLWATLLGTGTWRGELWNRRSDGRIYPEWMTISVVRDADGRTTHFVGVFTDIGDAKQAQADLDFLAHHDALTALPNRRLLVDRLEQAIRRAEGLMAPVAVLLLDLDRFRDVNDAFGHLVGDELLTAAARRIQDRLDPGGTLARFTGDEFVVIVEGHGVEQVDRLVRELRDQVALPYSIAGHDIVITATVGISLYPTDARDAASLLRNAQAALHRAKTGAPSGVGFYEAGLAARIEERFSLGRDLRAAVARNELTVHYQPQVAFATGSIVGAEALVRWQHPRAGLIGPGVFIPLAEELGVIGEIGEWVLFAACRQTAQWDEVGLRLPRIAVNLSLRQLEDPELGSRVRATLDRAGLAPGRLELEVTESTALSHPERSAATMRTLRGLGIDIAMDDFGTGHSSLAQLNRLPLDRLKIDMSFVRDIGLDPSSDAIIGAVIAFARSLGLGTIAEGVETEEQARFLRDAGCDVAQGYLFGRPMPPDAFLDAARDWPAGVIGG